MKAFKLLSVLFIFSILLLTTSCTQGDSIESAELDGVKRISQNFKILPINNADVRKTRYSNNYLVELESSNFDINKDQLQLEIPIPVGDFSFLRAYNVSTDQKVAILYVIQREKQNVVVNLPTRFVAQDELTLSELNINTELLAKNGCMAVYVMNNSEKDMNEEEDLITNCFRDTLNFYNCEDRVINNTFCDFTGNADGNKRPGFYKGGILR